MMHLIGNRGCRLAALLICLLAGLAQAAVEVAVDRREIAMGESFSLVLSSRDAAEIRRLDLRPLEQDFDILQRSQSSSTSIINGERTHTQQLSLELTPRREGSLRIPALGGSDPILIQVSPPVERPEADDTVLFTAELERDSVYVQQQVILTLRIEQAVNLEARSISELTLDKAFVVPLEQNSFQRTVDGRPWLVHEVRYAIFPERSGSLEIPRQTFTARESQGRRGGFDFGLGGQQLQRHSQPLELTVLPRPEDFPSRATWLPAHSVTLEQQWSDDPEQLQVGDSITRSVTLRAEGLQGAQLPPLPFEAPDGLRFYRDQPVIEDSENSRGVVGLRRDSAALVASEPGEWVLPEIRLPWWDTAAQELRWVVLPEQRVQVAAGSGTPAQAPPLEESELAAPDELAPSTPAAPTPEAPAASRLWPALALVFAIGWLLTLILWWRAGRGTRPGRRNQEPEKANSEAQAFRQLQAACTSHSAAAARRALLQWARQHFGPAAPGNLFQLAEWAGDQALSDAINQLERQLYAPAVAGDTGWQGDSLLAAVRDLRRRSTRPGEQDTDALRLYP